MNLGSARDTRARRRRHLLWNRQEPTTTTTFYQATSFSPKVGLVESEGVFMTGQNQTVQPGDRGRRIYK